MSKVPGIPDSKQALAAAYEQVVQSQTDAAGKRTTRRRGPSAVTWVSLLTLIVLGGFVWLQRPHWILRPAPAQESTVLQEANLRLALATTARKIEHYRAQHGRRPATLGETGLHPAGISYEVEGTDGYRLNGENGEVRLTLRSTDALPAFVGNSFQIITRRAP